MIKSSKEDSNYLKNNFKSLRIRAGYSQEDIAKQLGITRANFNKAENNPTNMKVSMLIDLAFYYYCDTSDFFKRHNNVERKTQYD